MKYGIKNSSASKLITSLKPLANMITQSFGVNNKFYAFVSKNPKLAHDLQTISSDIQRVLGIKPGPNGLYSHTSFSEKEAVSSKGRKFTYRSSATLDFLDALSDLQNGKEDTMERMLNENVGLTQSLGNHLSMLQIINNSFKAFQANSNQPKAQLDEAFDEIEDIDPLTSSMLDVFDNNVDMMSQSIILEPKEAKGFATATQTEAQNSLENMIDVRTGKRIGDLDMNQSFVAAPISQRNMLAKNTIFGSEIIEDYVSTQVRTGGQIAVDKYGHPLDNPGDLTASRRYVDESLVSNSLEQKGRFIPGLNHFRSNAESTQANSSTKCQATTSEPQTYFKMVTSMFGY